MDYPKVKVCLDTSEDNLIDELYTPCLSGLNALTEASATSQQGGSHTTSQDYPTSPLAEEKCA